MCLKFMPHIPASKVGGMSTTATQEKTFIAAFCSMLMRPSDASSRKVKLSPR